jgi:PAS domain S-box-containing protein
MEEVGYRAVFRAAPDGILLVDPEGRVRDLNPKAEELFGWERGELVGEPVEVLVPEGVRGAHARHRQRYHDDPHARPMGIGMELMGRRRDGAHFPVEISLSPIRQDGRTFVIATVRDVTQRNRLREFGAGALRATEEERRRIARELHDDVAQRVATVLLRLRVARRVESDSERDEILHEIREDLSGCSEAIRRLARGLRPPALEDAGLAAALRAHVRERLEGEDLAADLEVHDVEGDVDQDLQLVVYRVVQEGLSNAIRHADADRVRIRVERRRDRLVAEVEDDGRGFELPGPLESVADGGLGLIGMEERAHAVGGELEIDTAPGEGTRVRIVAPLREGAETRSGEGDHG